ncbi:MAG: DUF4082 domain-containing protein [Chitinophagaceae bacterium]|nr:DUF4082 domain-containing protein [Chitinophagaceae bacterium]
MALAVNGQSANILIAPAISNVTVNQSFSVNVNVDMISGDADVAEVRITFDNTKLQVTSVTKPSSAILPTEALPLDPVSTMNSSGVIRYSAGTSSNFPTADFTLLTVNFTVIGGANTSTALNFAVPPTTVVRAGSEILNTTINGVINIAAACTPPTATISNTATCNGQSFNLVLQSATGTAPFDLVINGNTYNNVNIGGVITTIAPPNENLWTPADAPSDLDLNDASDIEVGTKFTASVNGFVRGVRFYKGPSSSGTFTGKLYDFNNPATPLANANFVTSPSGWQQVLFSSPVAITAGTTYVVSVYSSTGDYSSSDGYFNVPLVSGSLTAPAGDNGTTSSSNGLYLYGSGMPINSYNNSSYFVDVVFTPASFTYNLTSVTGDDGCINTGALQTLSVTSPACSTLPVTLLSLSATPQDNSKVIVKWSTSSEINNKGFEVQRSLDGRNNWQTIAFVQGAGDSYSVKNYSYTDGNLVARRYFYQLKQVDIDGRYKYSMVVSANLSTRDGYSLEQNFPNPTGGSQYTTIRFTLPRRTNVTLSLYDLSGRLIQTLATGNRDAGTHAIPFDPSKLSTGLYYYKLQTEDFTDTKKMTVR